MHEMGEWNGLVFQYVLKEKFLFYNKTTRISIRQMYVLNRRLKIKIARTGNIKQLYYIKHLSHKSKCFISKQLNKMWFNGASDAIFTTLPNIACFYAVYDYSFFFNFLKNTFLEILYRIIFKSPILPVNIFKSSYISFDQQRNCLELCNIYANNDIIIEMPGALSY